MNGDPSFHPILPLKKVQARVDMYYDVAEFCCVCLCTPNIPGSKYHVPGTLVLVPYPDTSQKL